MASPTITPPPSPSSNHIISPHTEALAEITRQKQRLLPLYGPSQSTAEFIKTKLDILKLDLEYCAATERGLLHALEHRVISDEIFDEAIRDMNRDSKTPKQREIAILRRQKRRITEDLNLTGEDITDQLYTRMMAKKIAELTCQKKRRPRPDPVRFKNEVLNYYCASRPGGVYCSLAGSWVDQSMVRAAHLVPKFLDAVETGYLFDEGESPCANPRNSKSFFPKTEPFLWRRMMNVLIDV